MIKTFSITVALTIGLFSTSFAATPTDFPSKPIKMYVGFSPGSATDIIGRVVAEGLSKRLGEPIIVENRVGAGGSLAAQTVANSPADGYTLLAISSAIAVNPAVYKSADAVMADLEGIALIGYLPTVLMVSEKVPVSNMKEFLDYAKKKRGELNFGSSGVGGSTHMAMEAFSSITDADLTHIPYKGNGEASAALLGNQIEAMMDTLLLAAPVISSKRAKGLAISGEKRSSLIPNVPTFAEAGVPEYNRSLFFGIMGPKGMPDELVKRLNKEVNMVLQDTHVQERLTETGGLTLSQVSAEEFNKTLNEEVSLWKSVGSNAGIVPQ